MSSQPSSRAYLVGAFVAASVIPALALFSAPQSQVVHVESSFVQVDATVTDKNGNRIRDLKSDNFQLFEDNKPQKLTAVDYCDVHEYGTDDVAHQATVSLNYADDPQTLRAVAGSHRLIVLFFERPGRRSRRYFALGSSSTLVRERSNDARRLGDHRHIRYAIGSEQ